MPNIAKFLTHNEHLQPLLAWYCRQIAVVLKQPNEDYGYIQKLDGDLVGIQTYVACQGSVGSKHLMKGYWYAFMQSLKQKDESPRTIRIVCLISHNELHWSTSVSTFTLDREFYQKLKKALSKTYTEDELNNMTIETLRHFINTQFFATDVVHDFDIKGSKSIDIDHYDSHAPNNPISRYSTQYFKTLAPLIEFNAKNEIKIVVQPKNCKQQLGNTCGDYSVFNGVVAGILALDIGHPSYQMNTVMLRSLSEHVIPKLKTGGLDNGLALQAAQKINILVGKLKADELTMTENVLHSSPSFRKK